VEKIMIVSIKRSRCMKAEKTNSSYRVMFFLFLILVISPLASCMPPAVTVLPTESTATEKPTATVVEPASATPTISLTATTTSAALEISTATSASAGTSFTFIANADARVEEENPDQNDGDGRTLRIDGETDLDIESFIRFNVTGLSGAMTSARLRVYAPSSGSNNGPAVYPTDPVWVESSITWNTRPARIGDAIDNKRQITGGNWVEFDVTPQITQNGIFSFVLVADSNNGIAFSSREGENPPELVIILGNEGQLISTSTPPAGPVVLVGAGDISSCDSDFDELTAQLLDAIPGTVFTTGDNVYEDGTTAEYAECYDPTWGRHKDRTQPVPGNHEYHTSEATGYFQYFNNIPPYYAYDLGDWRIYALNSEIDASAESSQLTWLQDDLLRNPRQCVLAYWHTPRWSSGSRHGIDRDLQTFWEILYAAGADLVINGHEHNYERFAPMNAAGEADPLGLREIVVGTGGKNLYEFGTPLPTSEVRNDTSFGVLKLTLHPTAYEWEFIPVAGATFTDRGSTDCH
jgi:acid phosphatase type 7